MAILSLRISLPGPMARFVRFVRRHLPPLNFITLHYLYFIGVSFLASFIFYGSSTPARSIRYIDSLFLCISAMTLAGMNTVNLSELNSWQQVILFFLTMLGSAILVSSMVVHVRRKAFEIRFKNIVEEERRKRAENKLKRTRTLPLSMALSKKRTTNAALEQIPPVDGVVNRGSVIHERKDEDHPDHANDGDHGGALANLNGKNGTNGTPENGTFHPSSPPLDTLGPHIAQHGIPEDNTEKRDTTSSPSQEAPPVDHIKFRSDTRFSGMSNKSPLRSRQHGRVFTMSGVGARQDLQNDPYDMDDIASYVPAVSFERGEEDFNGTGKYFQSTNGWIGRNSQFQGLSLSEREKLGGVEYRAIKILAFIVPIYFVLWQVIGAIACGAWIAVNRPDTTRSNGLNPWWVGAFNAISAFNNNGMSLLDANMVAFQTSIFTLIVMGLLILAGNTAYPIFLRLTIWAMERLLPNEEVYRDQRVALQFLLDHPRRCYTTLFPRSQTYWLIAALVTLNGLDWIMFEILNIGNPAVDSIPAGYRWLDGLFQAVAVRSGGFYVVTIASLRSGLLVLYVLMMYISVYPVAITMRSSNTYEERSLGIYAEENRTPPDVAVTNIFGAIKRRFTSRPGAQQATGETRGYFIRQQLRGQLAHDLWWICLAVLFITITETGQFERDPVVFSTFNIIFETISAYGCVGISTGVPWDAYSFSGAWHTFSKLVLCAVMLRGRHRGLPVAIDRAVLLPGEGLYRTEEEDGAIKMERSQLERTLSVKDDRV